MPLITVTKLYDDGQILTEAMLDAIKDSVEDAFNTTKLDSDNIQTGGIATASLADVSVTEAKLANDAVTTVKIDDGAVTLVKLDDLTRALQPGQTINIGLEVATTTDANDSIRVTSSDGSALSSTNKGYVCVPGTTPGTVAVLSLTADVTLKLTGAHAGLGTLGDASDVSWAMYAINDSGTLKWGASRIGLYQTITVANSSATQTSITTIAKMLVTSTLGGTSACVTVGRFLTDFDDTGGASEDLHTVQSGAGEIVMGTNPINYTPNYQISTSCGSVSTTSNTYVDVANLSCTITTTGRPVMAMLIPVVGEGDGFMGASSSGVTSTLIVALLRDAAIIGTMVHSVTAGTAAATNLQVAGALTQFDIVPAGTYTYKVQYKRVGATAAMREYRLLVYEL